VEGDRGAGDRETGRKGGREGVREAGQEGMGRGIPEGAESGRKGENFATLCNISQLKDPKRREPTNTGREP